MNNPIIRCRGLQKVFEENQQKIEVIRNVDFTLSPGQSIAIVGASGSGKSTLLNVLGGLERPSAGEVLIDGTAIHTLNERRKGALRNRTLGFVYQFHHLLPEFSALENVGMPLLIGGMPIKEIKERARRILDQVGLSHRLSHKPAHLSGGERQRVAIARALVTEPKCVLMDEPTGNLDPHTADAVQALIHDLQERLRTAFVVVTHDRRFASKMDAIYRLNDGELAPFDETQSTVV